MVERKKTGLAKARKAVCLFISISSSQLLTTTLHSTHGSDGNPTLTYTIDRIQPTSFSSSLLQYTSPSTQTKHASLRAANKDYNQISHMNGIIQRVDTAITEQETTMGKINLKVHPDHFPSNESSCERLLEI
jgi:hypothetical protein